MSVKELLESDLKQAFNSILLTKSASVSRLLKVHPSEIPICPTRFIYSWIAEQHNLLVSSTLRDAITLNIGTTVHKCIQTFLPIDAGSRMLGDWTCSKCRKRYHATAKPDSCSRCGSSDFLYDELEIDYKGFAGHIDTVYKTEEGNAIVDYKTATLSTYKEKALNPGINYQLQIRAYALLLKLQYDIICKDAFLVFLAKEKPSSNTFELYHEHITKDVLKETFLILQHQRQLKKQLIHLKTFDEFLALDPEPCGNPFCPTCKDHQHYLEIIKQAWDPNLFPIIDYIKEKV